MDRKVAVEAECEGLAVGEGGTISCCGIEEI
jgi:hypothetical protein